MARRLPKNSSPAPGPLLSRLGRWLAVDFHSFGSGAVAPAAWSGKTCVCVVVVDTLSSDPTQSPAHSFVPRTDPTSLQPICSFGCRRFLIFSARSGLAGSSTRDACD